MIWEFCKYCKLNGKCENQDRGHKCETVYKIWFEENKELSSKVLKLEKELSDAKEYCDYSIKNREQLTKQINYWMDKYEQLEKKLDIAVKCLSEYASPEQWEDCTDENGVLYFKGLFCNEGHLNAVYALEKIKEVK